MFIAPQDLIFRVKEIASLPDFFYKLDEMINSPTVSFKQIGDTISEDAGLSVRLLRLANSALFNFPKKIDTIQSAISVIGTKQLRDLILATTIIDMFKNLKNDIITMKSFWEHSIACGIVARVLATYMRDGNVERFYLMGLLHDIGRVILFSTLPEKSREILNFAANEKIFLYRAEHNMLGFDHAHLGGLLLKQWRLTDVQQEAVQYHHAPARSNRFPMEVTVVHASDIVVNALRMGTSGERLVPILDKHCWANLQIPETQLPALIAQVVKQYSVAVQIFLSAEEA